MIKKAIALTLFGGESHTGEIQRAEINILLLGSRSTTSKIFDYVEKISHRCVQANGNDAVNLTPMIEKD